MTATSRDTTERIHVTTPLLNKRRSARIVRFDPQSTAVAARLAERDAAYRAALGVEQTAPLPAALGTQTGVELTQTSRSGRP